MRDLWRLGEKGEPDGDGEKIYAYDSMRILKEVSGTWARLYEVVANSQDKELGISASLRKQLAKCNKIQDQQRLKLQGELLTTQGQIWVLQDEISKRGMSITGLEQKLAALSFHPAKIVGKKPHTALIPVALALILITNSLSLHGSLRIGSDISAVLKFSKAAAQAGDQSNTALC